MAERKYTGQAAGSYGGKHHPLEKGYGSDLAGFCYDNTAVGYAGTGCDLSGGGIPLFLLGILRCLSGKQVVPPSRMDHGGTRSLFSGETAAASGIVSGNAPKSAGIFSDGGCNMAFCVSAFVLSLAGILTDSEKGRIAVSCESHSGADAVVFAAVSAADAGGISGLAGTRRSVCPVSFGDGWSKKGRGRTGECRLCGKNKGAEGFPLYERCLYFGAVSSGMGREISPVLKGLGLQEGEFLWHNQKYLLHEVKF